MPKTRRKTDLEGLMGTANRSRDIPRPGVESQNTSDVQHKNTDTPEQRDTGVSVEAVSAERRVNVAVRESLHKPLRLYAVKNDQQVRDVVELALRRFLEAEGELEPGSK